MKVFTVMQQTNPHSRILIIVAGLSGAGRSTALHRFEDLGFLTLENLPPVLLSPLLEKLDSEHELASYQKVALTIKSDTEQELTQLILLLDTIENAGFQTHIVFLDSSTESIVKRYSETRRPHPKFDTQRDASLSDTVARERQRLDPLKERAHLVVDTTTLSIHDLRRSILAFAKTLEADVSAQMRINIQSFGFKYGAPRHCDLLMDVRFLDNPYFDPKLRVLSGLDKPIAKFVVSSADGQTFLKHYSELLSFLIPRYQFEGKAYLTVGIGCTGGRHRSVAIAEALATKLSTDESYISVQHRDINRKKR